MCIQTWFISCGHRGNTVLTPRPKTYITHTYTHKGRRPTPRDRVHVTAEAKSQEREKKEICRKKLPEGKKGKKIK